MIYQHDGSAVTFAFYRPAARNVRVAGDFNAWSTGAFHLRRDADGWWRGRLSLPPGDYRFRYLVDDRIWEADFAAFGVEQDRDGHWNSVLSVTPHAAPAHRAAA